LSVIASALFRLKGGIQRPFYHLGSFVVGVALDVFVRIEWRRLVWQNIEGHVQRVKGLVICFTVLVFAVARVGGMAGIPTRLGA
jgi:hypothetical protein